MEEIQEPLEFESGLDLRVQSSNIDQQKKRYQKVRGVAKPRSSSNGFPYELLDKKRKANT